MANNPSPSQFLFIGNDPCLDFINTEIVSQGRPMDLLATYDDVVTWLMEARQLAKADVRLVSDQLSQAGKREVLEEAKAFRGTLRTMVQALAEGGSVPKTAIVEINDRLRAVPGYRALVQSDGRHFKEGFVPTADPRAMLSGTLAMTASRLLCFADWGLVKKCKNPACVLYFYDTTKNHARSWCSMQVCGNREKVAAYFKRQRKRRR